MKNKSFPSVDLCVPTVENTRIIQQLLFTFRGLENAKLLIALEKLGRGKHVGKVLSRSSPVFTPYLLITSLQ